MGLAKICTQNKGEYFKFNQGTTTLFDDLCSEGASSRVGLCAGLSTVWFYQTVKEGKPSIINSMWVDGGGRGDIASTTSHILEEKGGGTWVTRCQKQMELKGFKPLTKYDGLRRSQIEYYFTQNNWTNMMLIIYGNAENSHAVAVRKSGEDIKFFDANCGYFHFTKTDGFLVWFKAWADKTELSMGTYYSTYFFG